MHMSQTHLQVRINAIIRFKSPNKQLKLFSGKFSLFVGTNLHLPIKSDPAHKNFSPTAILCDIENGLMLFNCVSQVIHPSNTNLDTYVGEYFFEGDYLFYFYAFICFHINYSNCYIKIH